MPAPEVAPNTDWRVDGDGIGWLTLTRPKFLNALNERTVAEIKEHMEVAGKDPAVRAVVVIGQGRSFCAGGDLNLIREAQGADDSFVRGFLDGLADAVRSIIELDKPVIAAVNGTAFGAGMNLALACDLVFASREAQFQQSFARLGLVPDTGGTWLLPRLVGLHKAKELAFMGDTLSAQDALALGLVNHVVDHDDLLPWVQTYAARLAAGPTRAFALTKRLMQEAANCSLAQALGAETDAQIEAVRTQDHAEGLESFREKRAPRFLGR